MIKKLANPGLLLSLFTFGLLVIWMRSIRHMDAGYIGVGSRAIELRIERGGVRIASAEKIDLDFSYLGESTEWWRTPPVLCRVNSTNSSNVDLHWWIKGGNAYYMSPSPYVLIPIWIIGVLPIVSFLMFCTSAKRRKKMC